MLTVASSHAASNAPYVGAQLGYGDVHQFHDDDHGKDTGVAGRLFAGYQFNDYFATEMGWSKFSNATASYSYSDAYNSANAKATIKTDALDLVVKGILPVTSEVKVYGKLGAAYVMSRGNAKVSYSTIYGNGSDSYMKPNVVLPYRSVVS